MVKFIAPTPRFTPSQRWSFKNNVMCGICLVPWVELLITHWHHVDLFGYWQRVLFITAIAAFNTLLAIVEWWLHRDRIREQPVNPRPLFILGHPRTGTTLLHNLIAKDTHTFGFCSTFCAGFPTAFLWFERFKWLLAGMVDSKRPMDNMELSLDVPQEDELAINVMSAGTSPYMPITLMTAEPHFRPYFSFRDAPAEATRRWVDCFMYMLRKLSLRCGGKRLLLKSPVHTARVELLLKLFPDAQFVYIHRHPEAVYKSACHMADTTYWHCYLKAPTDEQVHEFILNQFVVLWDEYARARGAIPKGNLVEVGYDELSADPTATIGRIYRELGIGGFEDRVRGVIDEAGERNKHATYKTNAFSPLPAALKAKVAQRWAAYTKAWGYDW